MKKTAVFLSLFAVAAAFAGMWFSPLARCGAYVCENNRAAAEIGLCYPEDSVVRYDFFGTEEDMYAALDKLCARVVKTAHAGGALIVYAYCARVISEPVTADGAAYNVMAAFRDGRISIGTPVLAGSY